MADLDENIIRRSLPFGVDTSIGAVETHASENLILHDSEICDYSDRLLVQAGPSVWNANALIALGLRYKRKHRTENAIMGDVVDLKGQPTPRHDIE